jgi:hypothetical protein
VHVRARFRRPKESRATGVTKTRIIGGRARKTLRQNWQEGRKGPDYRKKHLCDRDNVRAVRMACVGMSFIVDSAACARSRGAAEPCLKFGNAIREDRAVLYRGRPNHWTRYCTTASHGMRSRMPVHLQIFSNKQTGRRHSSVTEHAPRKDETEV